MQPAPSENKRARESSDFDKDAQMEIDARSIYVGNVEYLVDSAILAEFFSVWSSADLHL